MPSKHVRKKSKLSKVSGLHQTFKILEDVAALVYTCGYDVCIFAEKKTPMKDRWKTVNFGFELSHVVKTRNYLSGFKTPETDTADRRPVDEHEVWTEDELVEEPGDELLESAVRLESADIEEPQLVANIKIEPQSDPSPAERILLVEEVKAEPGAAEQVVAEQVVAEQEAVMEEDEGEWKETERKTETELCLVGDAESWLYGETGEQASRTESASGGQDEAVEPVNHIETQPDEGRLVGVTETESHLVKADTHSDHDPRFVVKATDIEYQLEKPIETAFVEGEAKSSRPAITWPYCSGPAITQRDTCRPARTQRGTWTGRNCKSTGRRSSSTRLHKCTMCNYETNRTCELRSHMRAHTVERPFKCTVCDYSCSRSAQLRFHMQTHTGERPFKCSLCNYSSIYPRCLTRHVRTHTGERPFKCAHCDYSTGDSSNFARHMRTHTGERPYKCSLCDYSGARSTSLTEHMRTHTGEYPFKCLLCDYSAARSASLITHMRIHR